MRGWISPTSFSIYSDVLIFFRFFRINNIFFTVVVPSGSSLSVYKNPALLNALSLEQDVTGLDKIQLPFVV